MANVTFSWGNLPAGFCWTGPQEYMDTIFALLSGTLGTGAGIIVSSTLPSPADQDKIWVRTNPDGTMEGIYKYQGFWHRPHRIGPSALEFMIWKGTEADLWAYDGGDGTNPSTSPPSDFTGAMWQRDTDMDFKFPVGIGTNPVTYGTDPATVIGVGTVAGDEKVVLDAEQSGTNDHEHVIGRMRSDTIPGQGDDGAFMTGTTSLPLGTAPVREIHGAADGVFSATMADEDGQYLVTSGPQYPGLPTATTAHQNMPPYRGVIFARRTSRKYITALV